MDMTILTLGELIENNVDIFDFNYPVYDERYRKTFESHFIDYFYYDEIGQETVARFKHRLKIKLNLIMPYYNKLIMADNLEQRILDNYDVTETFTKKTSNSVNSTNDNELKNLYTETPKTKKTDIENIDYLNSITKDIGKNTSKTTGDGSEQWERRMQGNIGVQTDADAIIKYWDSLRKIELEIFNECEDLFMGVY